MVAADISGQLTGGVSRRSIVRLAGIVLRRARRRGSYHFSVSLVSRPEIARLNRRFLRHDRPTDVLSFGYGPRGAAVPQGAPVELGEIVICTAQVRAQARRLGRPYRTEFGLMVIHGVLHLLGFDHDTPRREALMFGLQQDALILAGLL